MNTDTFPDACTLDATMNAVILYDDFDSAARASAAFERAARRADDALSWNVKPWRLDLLESPLTAEAALADAADAHLVLLSLRHPSSLPAPVLDWLEQWAARRQVQDAALAVWDGGNGDALTASSASDISHFAERHGLSFILGDAAPVESDLPVLLRDLLRPEVQMPPALNANLMDERLWRASDWGINE